MTTQPLFSASAMACSCSTLFPLPFSPNSTLFTASFALPSSPPSAASRAFAISTVSFLITVAGFLNRFHAWVCLKASSDLRASTFASVRLSTCPSSSASFAAVPFSLLSSCSPLTSSALVLLNTTFLRSAFLSPGAGGLPVVSRLFLFSRRVVPWREVALATAPFFFGGLAASEGEVEKAAR
jgi:hypothetical protein